MSSPPADGGRSALDPSKKAALIRFRKDFFDSLSSWDDALFELTDAVLCSPSPISSVPSLSLEPVFRRSHGSVYKALARGSIDDKSLRQALVDARPVDWPLIFAVDASTWDRCDAETSPERGFYYSPSKHSAGQPIVAGWSYQWITQLNWPPDSWTAPVDAMRIAPSADATTATIGQVRRLVDLLPSDGEVPMFVFDAGYDPIAISAGLADTRVQVLVRIRSDRVFYADPVTPKTGGAGRPRRHGRRFKLSEANTAPRHDAELQLDDPRYGKVRVRAWHNLHPRLHRRGRWSGENLPPIVPGTVIRVDVEHLPNPIGRTKKTLWLWWSGPDAPNLEICFRAYLRRFDIEHTYRFAKNTLGWTTPSVRNPQQADRWTWLVVAAYTQLRLARASLTTCDCRGNGPPIPPNSPPLASAEDFVDFEQPSARPPAHRNPTSPVPDAPRAPGARPERAIQRSKKAA